MSAYSVFYILMMSLVSEGILTSNELAESASDVDDTGQDIADEVEDADEEVDDGRDEGVRQVVDGAKDGGKELVEGLEEVLDCAGDGHFGDVLGYLIACCKL